MGSVPGQPTRPTTRGTKEYFYNLGIETKGFIQWQDGSKEMPGGNASRVH